jgi:hypothetical protein
VSSVLSVAYSSQMTRYSASLALDRLPPSCATVTVLRVTSMKIRTILPTRLPLAVAPDFS